MAWLCKIFGHKFQWHLCSGDYGEPAEDRCSRCGLQTVHIGLCRCLTPQCGCVAGLLNAVRQGRVPGRPLIRDDFWRSDDGQYIEDQVLAIIEHREATQPEDDEDLAPVVFDVPRTRSL